MVKADPPTEFEKVAKVDEKDLVHITLSEEQKAELDRSRDERNKKASAEREAYYAELCSQSEKSGKKKHVTFKEGHESLSGSETKDSEKLSDEKKSEEPTSEKPLVGRGNRKKEEEEVSQVTDENAGVTLIWNEISVRVPIIAGGGIKMPRIPFITKDNDSNTRVVLDKVSGLAKPGELLAIMGGSGAGKTTLLNVLTNIDQKGLKKSGTVTINGEPLKAEILKRISAYVQQYDIFIGTLTVREQITFSAKLRMGRRATEEEKKNRIEEVIRDFNLTNAQNTMIGVPNRQKGISIGEKKRLAFASEILTDPYLFFCDEPTSGLDAFMAKQVAIMMKKMAQSGKTVITTIHQPSSEVFSMFDKVCFMANGRIVYLGPTSEVCNFWKSVGPSFACPKTFNPADHVIRTLSATSREEEKNKLRVERIRQTFETSHLADDIHHTIMNYKQTVERANVLKGRPSYAANWITQLWVLLVRSFRTTVRDPLLLKVRLIQVVVTSLIIGIVNMNFRGDPIVGTTVTNMEGVLYNCARDMNFMFLFPSVNVITGELPIFLREHRSGIYSVDTYYLSKSLAEFPQYTVLPIIYSIIVYWMTGLTRTFVSFAIFTIFNMMQTHVAISMAYAGACAFAEESLALTYMPVIVLPMLVFGGFYISFQSIPVYFKWASYLSWYRYGFEGLMANQWQGNVTIGGCESPNNGSYFPTVSLVNQTTSYCPATTSSELMERRGMQDAHWWRDLLILFVMFVALRIAGLVALTLRVTEFKLKRNSRSNAHEAPTDPSTASPSDNRIPI